MLEPYAQWLKAQPKSRFEQNELTAGYVEVFPEFRSDGNLRARVRAAVDALAERGVLRLPATRSGWDAYGTPKLPQWAILVREKVEKPDFSSVNWLPELSFATAVLRASQLEKLKVINQFLIERRNQLTVTLPFRERALEIFGDEKAFDGAVKGDLLYGKIPLSVIGACNPEPPLAREDFVGSSGALLVLENHHTYWSVLQWNREALRYRSIGYGSGNTILKSARAIGDALVRSGAPYAEYFGDLDPTGVYIASMLDRGLREQGSPSLQAAGPFYRWLLANGRRRPLGDDKRIRVGSTVEWLPPDLLEGVRLLFEAGQWIPQESLSLSVLQSELFA